MDPDDFPTPDVDVDALAPADLKARIDGGDPVTVLDTRAPSDVEEWRVDGDDVTFANVPYYEFLGEAVDEELLSQVPAGEPVVTVCAKGISSEYVAAELVAAGREAVYLDAGMRGWARLYERREVTAYDGPGAVYQYHRPSSGCLGYLLVAGGEAAVIDPLRAFTERYLADAAEFGAELTYALDTHVHADHVSGVRALAAADEGVTGVVPEASVDRGITYADRVATAADGDAFRVGDATVEALYTPGHTSGMTSYLLGGSLLASGDGLFVESVARPDLEAGDEDAPDAARRLHRSLQEEVRPLPDDTLVGGGHASDAAEPAPDGTYTAPLGELFDRMDALDADEERFVETVLADVPPRPANHEAIVATNLGRRTPDDEEAFTLELGPNNCAASRDALTGD